MTWWYSRTSDLLDGHTLCLESFQGRRALGPPNRTNVNGVHAQTVHLHSTVAHHAVRKFSYVTWKWGNGRINIVNASWTFFHTISHAAPPFHVKGTEVYWNLNLPMYSTKICRANCNIQMSGNAVHVEELISWFSLDPFDPSRYNRNIIDHGREVSHPNFPLALDSGSIFLRIQVTSQFTNLVTSTGFLRKIATRYKNCSYFTSGSTLRPISGPDRPECGSRCKITAILISTFLKIAW